MTFLKNIRVKLNNPSEKKEGLTNRTFKGFLWLASGKSFEAILRILILSVLARMISPEEFGLVSAALIIISFSRLFTEMGVGPAIVQKEELKDTHISTGIIISLLMGLILGSIIIIFSPYIASFFNMIQLELILKVTSIIFLLEAISLIGQALLQRKLHFHLISGIDIFSYLIGFGGIGIFLAYYNYGVWALVWGHIGRVTLKALLVWLIQGISYKFKFDLIAFKELMNYGVGLTIGKFANYIAIQGDNLIVGRVLTASSLGVYGRAYNLMVMPANLIGTALNNALFPTMSKVQNDSTKLNTAYLTGISGLASLMIPLSVFIFIMAKYIVLVLLGENWVEVTNPLRVLSLAILFRTSYKLSDSLARATARVYNRMWRQFVYAILILIGAYLGSIFHGIVGVSLGVIIAVFINFILMAGLSIRILDISWIDFIKGHFRGIFSGLVTGTITYGIYITIPNYIESSFLILFISIIIIIAFYLLFIKNIPSLFFNNYMINFIYKILPQIIKQKD